MKKYLVICSVISALVLYSCQKDEFVGGTEPVLPETPFDYKTTIVTGDFGWASSYEQDFDDNMATLGRVLFYDTKMSWTNTVSCGTCHAQDKAFTDGKKFGTGFRLEQTARNSPAINNPLFESQFFWDGRESSIQNQVLMPVRNHLEMGLDRMDALVTKLSAVEYYKPLFTKAFGDEVVNTDRISLALSTFVKSMTSYRTKYDAALASNDQSMLSSEEQQGKTLFAQHCVSCHGGNDFRGWGWANIGLEFDYSDAGVAGWMGGGMGAEGAFMIPSLRNVLKTAPYMHDGRFATINDVLEHYSHGIVGHPNLDFRLREDFYNGGLPIDDGEDDSDVDPFNVNPVAMNLSGADKEALIAFLGTLTDDELIHDVRFSDPFIVK